MKMITIDLESTTRDTKATLNSGAAKNSFDKLQVSYGDFEVRISGYLAPDDWRFNLYLPTEAMDRLTTEWCKQRGIGVGHVMVEVRGGVAEFTEVTEGIETEIVDWDCPES